MIIHLKVFKVSINISVRCICCICWCISGMINNFVHLQTQISLVLGIDHCFMCTASQLLLTVSNKTLEYLMSVYQHFRCFWAVLTCLVSWRRFTPRVELRTHSGQRQRWNCSGSERSAGSSSPSLLSWVVISSADSTLWVYKHT